MKRLPRARRDVLAVALEEEVVVYDPQRQRAHSLNRAALAVWKQCNGQHSLRDLGRLVSAELGLEIDEGTVWLAIRQLQSAHLLLEKVDPPEALSRRDILRKAGRIGVAAVATPVIASALVPVAAAAASRPAGLPRCGQSDSRTRDDEDETDDEEEEEGCSTAIRTCTCTKTTSGVRACVNHSTALNKTTCRNDRDCRPGYVCIPSSAAHPRCVALCAVPTCTC